MMRYDSTTLHALHDSMVLDSAAETWRVLTYHEMFLREGLKGWAQWMTTCFLPISGYCNFRSGNSMINANNSNNENCSCSFAFLQLFLPKVLRGGHWPDGCRIYYQKRYNTFAAFCNSKRISGSTYSVASYGNKGDQRVAQRNAIIQHHLLYGPAVAESVIA